MSQVRNKIDIQSRTMDGQIDAWIRTKVYYQLAERVGQAANRIDDLVYSEAQVVERIHNRK